MIQLVAMMYFEKIDIISIISILLSLISVCVKSIVVAYSFDLKTFLLQWNAMVVDYIGIYFVVSWMFFVPQSFEDKNDGSIIFPLIGLIYFYHILICLIPVGAFYIGAIYLFLAREHNCLVPVIQRASNSIFIQILAGFVMYLLAIVIFTIVVGGCSLLLEISLFAWISYYNNYLFARKVSTKNSANGKDVAIFWQNCRQFIANANKTPYDTLKRDRLVRLCCINQLFASKKALWIDDKDDNGVINPNNNVNIEELEHYHKRDVKLSEFFRDEGRLNLYNSVEKLHDISKHCDSYKIDSNDIKNKGQVDTSTIWADLFSDSCDIFIDARKEYFKAQANNRVNSQWEIYSWEFVLIYGKTAFVAFILYMIGRVMVRLLLPYYFLAFVWYYNIWNEIGEFQWAMMILYLSISIASGISFCFVMPLSRYMFYIFPGKKLPDPRISFDVVKQHYDEYISIRFREVYVVDVLGNDIGSIINEYVGRFNRIKEDI